MQTKDIYYLSSPNSQLIHKETFRGERKNYWIISRKLSGDDDEENDWEESEEEIRFSEKSSAIIISSLSSSKPSSSIFKWLLSIRFLSFSSFAIISSSEILLLLRLFEG